MESQRTGQKLDIFLFSVPRDFAEKSFLSSLEQTSNKVGQMVSPPPPSCLFKPAPRTYEGQQREARDLLHQRNCFHSFCANENITCWRV